MQFGFTLKPDHTDRAHGRARAPGRGGRVRVRLAVRLARPVARAVRPPDAHRPGDTRLRLGTCVTNPATREPSVTASTLAVLDEVSRRADGPGDRPGRLRAPRARQAADDDGTSRRRSTSSGRSSRAARSSSRAPSSQLPWTGGWTLPVWVAGYGPMALAMTGRVADGVILQLADPDLIRWFVGQLRDAEVAAGRPRGTRQGAGRGARRTSATARDGRERTRWFPALVSNHVVDLVNKYPREQLPESLTGYVRDRDGLRLPPPRRGGLVERPFVTDEITDRFCVLGSAEEHVAKLRVLAEAGVDQFNLYLMNGDEEEQLEIYGSQVIPALRDVAAARGHRPRPTRRSVAEPRRNAARGCSSGTIRDARSRRASRRSVVRASVPCQRLPPSG